VQNTQSKKLWSQPNRPFGKGEGMSSPLKNAVLKKTLTAGSGNAAPSTLTGGAALQVEEISGEKEKKAGKSRLYRMSDLKKDRADLFKAPIVGEGYADVSIGSDKEGGLDQKYTHHKSIKTRNGNIAHIFHETSENDPETVSRTIFATTHNNKSSGKPISQIEVDHYGTYGEGPEVNLAWTHPEHRGKGLSSDLHRLATRHFGRLGSDYRLSPGSQKIWEKLGSSDIKTKMRPTKGVDPRDPEPSETRHEAKWVGKSEFDESWFFLDDDELTKSAPPEEEGIPHLYEMLHDPKTRDMMRHTNPEFKNKEREIMTHAKKNWNAIRDFASRLKVGDEK
jgi:hypothetical protein